MNTSNLEVSSINNSDPAVILSKKLLETYGDQGTLNIYNHDRKAAVDSFKCYWQIDNMIKSRNYGNFPLIENTVIPIDPAELKIDDDEEEDDLENLQNLQKEFKLPKVFFAPGKQERMKVKTMKGYRFFVPSDFIQTAKESEMKQKSSDNIITFQVKDLISIDFLDKMGDKEREIKIMCESACDDIIKNLMEGEAKSPGDKFLVSSKPYVRKSNLIADKALCQCWESHFRFSQFDLFITVIRRSYIAPIMDMFQDIVICSIKYFTEESNCMDQ